MKKDKNALFDVTMGSHDDAELAVIFLLGKLSNIIEKRKISLYRDDELKRKEKERGREKDVMLFSIMRD